MSELCLNADVIDSMAIIERLEELREMKEEREEYLEQLQEWQEETRQFNDCPEDFDEVPEEPYEVPDMIDEDKEELAMLEGIDCEGREHSSDWDYGETLIRRSCWVDYCQEMVEDSGYIPKDLPSWIEIDWEATARNMEQDYATIHIEGFEYLIRSS